MSNSSSNIKPSIKMINYSIAVDLVYRTLVILLLSLIALLLWNMDWSIRQVSTIADSINDTLNNTTLEIEYED